jgi:hypothetical protein
MKKTIVLLLSLTLLTTLSYAQRITYNQLHHIYKTWVQNKGSDVNAITAQLHLSSPKWKIMSEQPTIEDNTSYYAWTALDTKSDTTVIALYVKQDGADIKYSLRYAFNSKLLYDTIVQSLKASIDYKGSITSATDNSKGEYDLIGNANGITPYSFELSDYNLNSSAAHPRLFTVDIF